MVIAEKEMWDCTYHDSFTLTVTGADHLNIEGTGALIGNNHFPDVHLDNIQINKYIHFYII